MPQRQEPNDWETIDINTGGIINDWQTVQPQQPERSWWDTGAEMAISTAPSVVGSFFGPVGGAVGSGLGEMGRQMYANPDDPFNWGLIGTETAIGAIPFGKAGKGLWEGIKFGAKTGAAQAAIGSPFRHLAESGELPTLGQAATETGMGTVFGGAMGGAMHYLPQGKPRIDPGAGAENIDIGPPPPNLKNVTPSAPPPPFEATPPPPPSGGTPITSMHPSVDVSINDPARHAELQSQGYVPTQSDGTTIRFVRKDLVNPAHPEPTSAPIQDTRVNPEREESIFLNMKQIQDEFGHPVDARARGDIVTHTDPVTGRTGWVRARPAEPPKIDEPPIESYDNERLLRGETPFGSAKDNPLAGVPPLDIPLSEGEVEAKYKVSVAQAVHEGIVERVVQNGEVGYIEIQGDLPVEGIGGFRHIGDEPRGGSANETPSEDEIRRYLSRMLGRPATDDEVARAIERQARTGEFTGRVAPFPPPEILAMRHDDLGNVPTQPELPGFLRPGEGEPGYDFNPPPRPFDPNVDEVGPSGPREALQGFDEPRMGQQDLPFGAIGSIRPKKSIMDMTMQEADYEGAFSPGGRLTPRPPAIPEGPLPTQNDIPGLVSRTGIGAKPETIVTPAIKGGIDEQKWGSIPEWFNHPDRIGSITDPKIALRVNEYWHDLGMDASRRGDHINAENYWTLADLAGERHAYLVDNKPGYEVHPETGERVGPGYTPDNVTHTPEGTTETFNQAPKKYSGSEEAILKKFPHLIEKEPLELWDMWANDKSVDNATKYAIGDLFDLHPEWMDGPDGVRAQLANRHRMPRSAEEAVAHADNAFGRADQLIENGAVDDAHKVIHDEAQRLNKAGFANQAEELVDDWNAHVDQFFAKEQGQGKTPRSSSLESMAEELYDALESKGATPSPSIVLNILRHINSAKNTGEALRNLTDIGAFADSATTPLQREIFEDLHRRAHAKYYETVGNTRSPEFQGMIDEANNKGFDDEFNSSFKRWEQEQQQPYRQGQLDLPLGKYEPGVPRKYEPFPYSKPRNELGQFITAKEASQQQLPLEPEWEWDLFTGKRIPRISGGSGEPPSVPPSTPQPGDPPVQPSGNVPPESVPPGSKPPIPDEPPASVLVDKKKPPPIKSHWEQAYDAVRNLTTGLDISAPMRQGLPLISTKSWWTSWGSMLKAWGSQGAYDANMKSITDHYLFKDIELANGKTIKGFAKRMGLRIIDEIDHTEEVTASKIIEKYVPGMKASNRAYNAYLNKLRSDTFINLIEDAKRVGEDPFGNEILAREIAEFVNTATGAASIKMNVPAWMNKTREVSFEQSAKQLGYLLFSPRQTFSRARMLNPLTYSQASPYVRKQYGRALFSSLSAWGTIAGAASLSGYADEVSLDPTSADFGKIRIGNTRLDAGGGFQQYMVAAARLISGTRTTAASGGGRGNTQTLGEGYQARTGLDVAQMFLSNKLHPLTKFGYDMLAASQYQPFHVGDKIAQLVVPLYMQDAYEIIREDRPEILPLLFPAAIGMGTQTYEAGEASERMIPKEYDYLYQGGERPWSGRFR